MLIALVLLCSIEVTPDLRDCTRHNATAVLRVPGEFAHPAACLMQAQAFLAETSIAHEFGDDDRVKVVCARIIDDSMKPLTTQSQSGDLR
jgi:hypothetical protein